jgi:hypothetical protein
VLVERDNEQVAQSTAENPGARFPSSAIRRWSSAPSDPWLALRMLSPEIPPAR